MKPGSTYIGNELDLFEQAANWKKYYGQFLKPYIKGKVLEVGAGIGGTTSHLCTDRVDEWVCLEPDQNLGKNIKNLISEGILPSYCRYMNGTLDTLNNEREFDVILYIDVIEHIKEDGLELKKAASYLKTGGHLLILVPAHQYLFSPFDEAIGHFRRYSRKGLKKIIPKELSIEKTKYLDVFGLLTSFANKLILKQAYPTLKQVLFWDRNIVKLSRLFDPMLGYNFGKSCLLIAKKVQNGK